jgi:hypothetical protein
MGNALVCGAAPQVGAQHVLGSPGGGAERVRTCTVPRTAGVEKVPGICTSRLWLSFGGPQLCWYPESKGDVIARAY